MKFVLKKADFLRHTRIKNDKKIDEHTFVSFTPWEITAISFDNQIAVDGTKLTAPTVYKKTPHSKRERKTAKESIFSGNYN